MFRRGNIKTQDDNKKSFQQIFREVSRGIQTGLTT